MSAAYPGSAKTFTTKATNDTIQAAHVNDLQDEVSAVETALVGTIAHDVKLAAAKKFYEQGRTKALGEWVDVVFSAGNFTANGAMSWTVASGDQIAYTYMLVGNTMTLAFFLDTTTVGGTPDSELRIAIPGGHTSANLIENVGWGLDNSVISIHRFQAGVGLAYIKVFNQTGAPWTASTNATSVHGQITFAIA